MSGLVDTYNRQLTTDYRLRVLNEDFQAEFPLLGQCFTGVLSPDGKDLLLPPCKVTIWADSGDLQACLNPSVGRHKAFVGLGRTTDHPWRALEAALTVGVRWVSNGVQKSK